MYRIGNTDHRRKPALCAGARALLTATCTLTCLVTGARGQATAPEATADSARTERSAGTLAPRESHAWVRIRGIDALGDGLADHPIRLAWNTLRESGSRLTQSCADVSGALQRFLVAHGIAPDVFFQVLGTDTRIAVFGPGANRFVAALQIGDHGAVLQSVLERLPAVEGETGLHVVQHAFGGSSKVTATITGKTLVLGSDAGAVRETLERIRGDAASLADDEAFRSLGLTAPDDRAWLTFFANPTVTWRELGFETESAVAKLLLESGIAQLRAVAVHSTFENGEFEDRATLLLPPEGSFPLEFLHDGKPKAELARLVPPASTAWFAARVTPKGLLAFLKRGRIALPGVGRFEILEADLEARDSGLDDVATVFGPDILWLSGGPSATHGAVLTLEDSFRAKSLLGAIGTPVQVPGGEDQGIHEFKLERGGSTLHVALCDDFLLVSTGRQGLSTMLEQYLSGQARADVSERFAAAVNHTWLIGSEDAQARLSATDPLGQFGLQAIAEHFDFAKVDARRDGRLVRLRLHGPTGGTHLGITAFDRVLPNAVARRQEQMQTRVVQLAAALRDAQATFVQSAHEDRDEDGTGEAGTIADLVQHGLFEAPAELGKTGGEILEGYGYRFTILRPSQIEQAERHFAVVAWPAQPGITGRTSYLLSPDGGLWAHAWIPDLDAAAGPTLQQIFASEPWTDELVPAWERHRSSAGVAQPARPRQTNELTPLDLARAQLALDAARKDEDRARIREFLEFPDSTIQARAAHHLGDLKDSESVPELARLLKESADVEVRRRAARGLALIRGAKSSATLVQALAAEDATIRLFAATGLLGSRAPGAREGLLRSIHEFGSDTAGARAQAVLALHDLGDPSILADLVGVTGTDKRFAEALVFCFQGLSPELEPAKEAETLIKALASPVRPLRAYAIQRLGSAGHTEALPAMIARLEEEEVALQPALRLSIEALTPAKHPGLQERIASAKTWLQGLPAKLAKQPPAVKYGVALTPVALLALITLFWWSRRRRRRNAKTTAAEDFAAIGAMPAQTDPEHLLDDQVMLSGELSLDSGAEMPAVEEETATNVGR